MKVHLYIDKDNFQDFLNGERIIGCSDECVVELDYEELEDRDEYGEFFEFLMHVEIDATEVSEIVLIEVDSYDDNDSFLIYYIQKNITHKD